MFHWIKKAIYAVSVLVLATLLYVIVMIAYGTATDWQPEERIELSSVDIGDSGAIAKVVERDSLTFLNWNLGYGGLGAKSNFFYDAGGYFTDKGHWVRPPKEITLENQAGIESVVQANPSDFYLFQECDVRARRSHWTNQLEGISAGLPGYQRTFAVNFDVDYIPLPILQPWNQIGGVEGGLATFSRFAAQEAVRYDYPGQMPWPDRIFYLDRCMAVHRYPTAWGPELVVVNSHNEAYDEGGVVKKEEMAYLKRFLEAEYAKGNYVIVGADWNQCPPGVDYELFMKDEGGQYRQLNIEQGYPAAGWTWAYDPTLPTNRKAAEVYEPGKTFVTLIDFYLLSPNIELLTVQGVDTRFQWSDHQPVRLSVRLKRQ
jgi:endonuclease/exonuclease/phosphatase family metal-dependent hydrolase